MMNCVAQCYDGASVMSGRFGGVQKKVQEIVGKNCIYVHCYAHRLNLIVVSTASCIEDVRNFLAYLRRYIVLLLHQPLDMTSL